VAIRTLALNVFMDVVRKKALYVLVLFGAALLLAIPVIPSFGLGVQLDLFRDLALGLTSLFGVVIVIAVGVNQVPGEVEHRTIYNILSKPVSRAGFLAGKTLGLILTMAVVMAAMTTMSVIGTAMYFGRVELGLYAAGWAMFMEIALIGAFVVMVSTFASPPVTATLTIAFYFVGHVKTALLGPLVRGGASAVVGAAANIVPTLENLNVNDLVAHGAPVPAGRLVLLTVYALAYVLAFTLVAVAVFSRKDL
jgi:ABC-type transport system involved in multi-copper enzyme maturation permease subunit